MNDEIFDNETIERMLVTHACDDQTTYAIHALRHAIESTFARDDTRRRNVVNSINDLIDDIKQWNTRT